MKRRKEDNAIPVLNDVLFRFHVEAPRPNVREQERTKLECSSACKKMNVVYHKERFDIGSHDIYQRTIIGEWTKR